MWKHQGRVATGRSFIDPVGRVDTGRLGTEIYFVYFKKWLGPEKYIKYVAEHTKSLRKDSKRISRLM